MNYLFLTNNNNNSKAKEGGKCGQTQLYKRNAVECPLQGFYYLDCAQLSNKCTTTALI